MMDAILSTRFMVTFPALLSSITAKFHYFYSASIISARCPKNSDNEDFYSSSLDVSIIAFSVSESIPVTADFYN